MDIKPIVGTAIGLGAAGLAVSVAKDMNFLGKGKKMKIKPISSKTLLKSGGKILVGTALLGAASGIAKDL